MNLKTFLRNENGNISIIFAVSIVVFFSVIGVSIDYARIYNNKEQAQNILDASLLAAATEYERTGNKLNAQNLGIEHMTSSLPDAVEENLTIVVEDTHLSGTYSGQVQNSFLAAVSVASTSWNIESRINIGAKTTTDFALAIDVSNTMVTNNLLNGLHASLSNFSSRVFDNTDAGDVSVSVIPFANGVSFDPTYSKWLDPINGYSQTSFFNGCFENQSIIDINALSIVGHANRIAAFDRRKKPNGVNVPFCPETNSNAEFYIDNEADLTTKVANLTTAQGTNTADGLTWAWRALSPNWQSIIGESTVYPRAASANNNKVIILLTDGKPFAIPSVKLPSEDKDLLRVVALNEFLDICDQIIAAGNVDLYTIVYGNIMNEDQRNAIKVCTAGNGEYYWGGNQDQLTSILSSVVSKNKALALSR